MKVYPDVGFYTKTRITGKHFEKRKKIKSTENQKNTEYQNIRWGSGFYI